MASLLYLLLFASMFLLSFPFRAMSAISPGESIRVFPAIRKMKSWKSSSKLYAFGFYKEGKNYALGIFLNKNPATVFWTLNRNNTKHIVPNYPFSSLELTPTEGRFDLVYKASRSDMFGVAGIHKASMENNGNLVFYDEYNNRIWQSFDHPTDTLLPGQCLSARESIISRASENDYSMGKYRLLMQPDGDLEVLPVYSKLPSITRPIEENVALCFEENGVLSLRSGGDIIMNITKGGDPSENNIYRASIEWDGGFRVYSSRSEDINWHVMWDSIGNGECGLLGLCGDNAYCNGKSGCQCLPGFVPVNDSAAWRSGCRTSTTEDLKANGETAANIMMYKMVCLNQSSTWRRSLFGNDDSGGVLKQQTREGCETACLNDSSCEAAFYGDNGECRKQKLPLRYGRLSDDLSILLVKTQVASSRLLLSSSPPASSSSSSSSSAAAASASSSSAAAAASSSASSSSPSPSSSAASSAASASSSTSSAASSPSSSSSSSSATASSSSASSSTSKTPSSPPQPSSPSAPPSQSSPPSTPSSPQLSTPSHPSATSSPPHQSAPSTPPSHPSPPHRSAPPSTSQTSPPSVTKPSHGFLAIIIIISIAASITIFLGITCFLRLRHKARNGNTMDITKLDENPTSNEETPLYGRIGDMSDDYKSAESGGTGFLLENADMAYENFPRKFTQDQICQMTDFDQEIGRGGYAIVYKGVISGTNGGNLVVAVKRLFYLSVTAEKRFQDEIRVIGRTYHTNIVRLIGYCDGKSEKYLVYEFMPNGSLASKLYHKGNRLSWQECFQIVLDIADGIQYLHEKCGLPIMHCDIKPDNILLDDQMRAKIADFGLLKLLYTDQSKTMTTEKGTNGYIAPEWKEAKLPVSCKVDVYSFGIVLLEIICHHISDQEGRQKNLKEFVQKCDHEGDLGPLKTDSDVDMDSLKKLVKIGIMCIQDDPENRPSSKEVYNMLVGKALNIDAPSYPNATSQLIFV